MLAASFSAADTTSNSRPMEPKAPTEFKTCCDLSNQEAGAEEARRAAFVRDLKGSRALQACSAGVPMGLESYIEPGFGGR